MGIAEGKNEFIEMKIGTKVQHDKYCLGEK